MEEEEEEDEGEEDGDEEGIVGGGGGRGEEVMGRDGLIPVAAAAAHRPAAVMGAEVGDGPDEELPDGALAAARQDHRRRAELLRPRDDRVARHPLRHKLHRRLLPCAPRSAFLSALSRPLGSSWRARRSHRHGCCGPEIDPRHLMGAERHHEEGAGRKRTKGSISPSFYSPGPEGGSIQPSMHSITRAGGRAWKGEGEGGGENIGRRGGGEFQTHSCRYGTDR